MKPIILVGLLCMCIWMASAEIANSEGIVEKSSKTIPGQELPHDEELEKFDENLQNENDATRQEDQEEKDSNSEDSNSEDRADLEMVDSLTEDDNEPEIELKSDSQSGVEDIENEV